MLKQGLDEAIDLLLKLTQASPVDFNVFMIYLLRFCNRAHDHALSSVRPDPRKPGFDAQRSPTLWRGQRDSQKLLSQSACINRRRFGVRERNHRDTVGNVDANVRI